MIQCVLDSGNTDSEIADSALIMKPANEKGEKEMTENLHALIFKDQLNPDVT